jgi:hypothetical protein
MSTLATPVIQIQVEQSLDVTLIILLVIAVMRTLVDFIDVVTRLAISVATGGLGLVLAFAATVVVAALTVMVVQLN